MNITTIHFKVISCLKEEAFNLRELSDLLNTPTSKIRKCISDLEFLLKKNGVVDLHKYLSNNSSFIKKLKKEQSFTPEERRMYLILCFLKDDTINLFKISEELNITRRTLFNDLISLKIILNEFHLDVESLNSIGVKLNGQENNKRRLFKLYLLKVMLERQYLPSNFINFFNLLDELNNKNILQNKIEIFLKNSGIIYHTYSIVHLKVLVYIATLRRNYIDKNIQSSLSFKEFRESLNLNNICLFFSDFEIHSIRELQTKRYLSSNLEELKTVNLLVKYVNRHLKMNLKLNKEIIIQLVFSIALINFKKTFNIKEFYIYDKNISKDYLEEFLNLRNLFHNFFEEIDSFDSAILSMVFINIIHEKIEKQIESLRNILIVYNSFNYIFLEKICDELGLKKLLPKIKFISIYDLKRYSKDNKINGIIIFEDINIDLKKIKILKFNLPITKLDKFKLKVFLK